MLALIVAIVNPWVWQIYTISPPIFVILLVTTILLYFSIKSKRFTAQLLIAFCLLSYFQITTTKIEKLSHMSDDYQRNQIQRTRAYPQTYISIFSKTFWIPASYWLETKSETILTKNFIENLSINLDLNLFFFATHPRQRPNVKEIEKFSYFFLPFFILGIVNLQKLNKLKYPLILLGVSYIIFGFIGNKNNLGPFLVFPFIANVTAIGIEKTSANKVLKVLLITLFILISIQTFTYANY